jgi:hypothetical protein
MCSSGINPHWIVDRVHNRCSSWRIFFFGRSPISRKENHKPMRLWLGSSAWITYWAWRKRKKDPGCFWTESATVCNIPTISKFFCDFPTKNRMEYSLCSIIMTTMILVHPPFHNLYRGFSSVLNRFKNKFVNIRSVSKRKKSKTNPKLVEVDRNEP